MQEAEVMYQTGMKILNGSNKKSQKREYVALGVDASLRQAIIEINSEVFCFFLKVFHQNRGFVKLHYKKFNTIYGLQWHSYQILACQNKKGIILTPPMYNEQNGNNGLKLQFPRTKDTYAIQNLKLHKTKGVIVRCCCCSFVFALNILADKDQNLGIYAWKEHKTSDCLLIFYVPLISAGLYSVQRCF